MARIRTIKPDFWTDEKLTDCSLSARLLFIGTWNFADDSGNLDRSHKQIKARVFPLDNIECEPLILELIAQGLLIEYSVEGKLYLHIKGFEKHQLINRPSKPTCPVYEGSLSAHAGRKGKEGKGEEGDVPPDSSNEEKNIERQKRIADSCLALRNAGILDFSSINPSFIKLIDLGVTADEFADCAKSSSIKKFNYVIKAVSGRREDAEKIKLSPKSEKSSKRDWLKDIEYEAK